MRLAECLCGASTGGWEPAAQPSAGRACRCVDSAAALRPSPHALQTLATAATGERARRRKERQASAPPLHPSTFIRTGCAPSPALPCGARLALPISSLPAVGYPPVTTYPSSLPSSPLSPSAARRHAACKPGSGRAHIGSAGRRGGGRGEAARTRGCMVSQPERGIRYRRQVRSEWEESKQQARGVAVWVVSQMKRRQRAARGWAARSKGAGNRRQVKGADCQSAECVSTSRVQSRGAAGPKRHVARRPAGRPLLAARPRRFLGRGEALADLCEDGEGHECNDPGVAVHQGQPLLWVDDAVASQVHLLKRLRAAVQGWEMGRRGQVEGRQRAGGGGRGGV